MNFKSNWNSKLKMQLTSYSEIASQTKHWILIANIEFLTGVTSGNTILDWNDELRIKLKFQSKSQLTKELTILD